MRKQEFKHFQQLSKKHSEGLEYIYNSLSKKQTRSGKRLNVSEKEIIQLTKEFILKDKALSKDYVVTKGGTENIYIPKTKEEIDSILSTNLSEGGIELYNNLNAYIPTAKTSKELDDYTKSLISNSKFAKLTEKEQKTLMILFSITLDSVNYWFQNWDKWEALIAGKENVKTKGVVGPPASYYTNPDDPESMQRAGRIALFDAVGAITSLIPNGFNPLGWLTSAVVSSAGECL